MRKATIHLADVYIIVAFVKHISNVVQVPTIYIL